MWIMSNPYPAERRARAVKMVLDHLDEYRSVYAACQVVGPKVGVGPEPRYTDELLVIVS
jgi:transposase